MSIETLVHINGYYDILCALCLANTLWIPVLNEMHSRMFIDELDSPTRRNIGYFIFLQGCIRISFSINDKKDITYISYLAETYWIANETFYHNTIHKSNGVFVIVLCLLCAYLTKI